MQVVVVAKVMILSLLGENCWNLKGRKKNDLGGMDKQLGLGMMVFSWRTRERESLQILDFGEE